MLQKTLPRIQTRPRIHKHFPESKTLPGIQNHIPESKKISQNPKQVPESKTHPRIWILESVFEFWEVFWILGSVFVFWDVFWILVSVLSLRATVQCDCTSENYLENSELNCCTVKRIWDPDFTFGYWSSCFCPMLSSGHFAQNLVVLRYG